MQHQTKWIVGIICLLIIGTIGFVFKWEIYTRYYNVVNNHYSPGDKVYSKDFFDGRPTSFILAWRLIGPIDKSWEAKPYVIRYSIGISGDSLIKRRSACIGTYNKHEILNIKNLDGKIASTNFYAITPIYPVKKTWYEQSTPPAGYTYIDSNLYVFAFQTIDHEAPMFLKK